MSSQPTTKRPPFEPAEPADTDPTTKMAWLIAHTPADQPLPLRFFPDPVLLQPAHAVTVFDASLHAFGARMIHTMNHANGLGLAAPQVGVLLAMAVVNVDACTRAHNEAEDADADANAEPEPKINLEEESPIPPLVLVNPRLVTHTQAADMGPEGCLSIPHIVEDVARAQGVTVAYQDLDGAHHTTPFADLAARCIQHEIDHLHGVLFWDHFSRIRRRRLIATYHAAQAEQAEQAAPQASPTSPPAVQSAAASTEV